MQESFIRLIQVLSSWDGGPNYMLMRDFSLLKQALLSRTQPLSFPLPSHIARLQQRDIFFREQISRQECRISPEGPFGEESKESPLGVEPNATMTCGCGQEVQRCTPGYVLPAGGDQCSIDQFEIQYLVTPLYVLARMFYFPYPTYLVPNAGNWFLPVAEFLPSVPPTEEEQNSNFCKQTIADTILIQQPSDEPQQLSPDDKISSAGRLPAKMRPAPRDEDYRPQTYISRKGKKSQQLQNRNVIPNIIRLILSFIQKRGKSVKIVERILAVARSSIPSVWSTKRFYLYQAMIRGKMDNYVNGETLRQLVRVHADEDGLFPLAEQEFYNGITRRIIDYFLREEIAVCVLTSKRMDRSKKTHHLVAIRNICEGLRGLFRE